VDIKPITDRDADAEEEYVADADDRETSSGGKKFARGIGAENTSKILLVAVSGIGRQEALSAQYPAGTATGRE